MFQSRLELDFYKTLRKTQTAGDLLQRDAFKTRREQNHSPARCQFLEHLFKKCNLLPRFNVAIGPRGIVGDIEQRANFKPASPLDFLAFAIGRQIERGPQQIPGRILQCAGIAFAMKMQPGLMQSFASCFIRAEPSGQTSQKFVIALSQQLVQRLQRRSVMAQLFAAPRLPRCNPRSQRAAAAK
jgi:hypothetical protein